MDRESPRSEPPDAERIALVEELEHRIEEIENLNESELGNFTSVDWVVCVLVAVVIPFLVLVWFAG